MHKLKYFTRIHNYHTRDARLVYLCEIHLPLRPNIWGRSFRPGWKTSFVPTERRGGKQTASFTDFTRLLIKIQSLNEKKVRFVHPGTISGDVTSSKVFLLPPRVSPSPAPPPEDGSVCAPTSAPPRPTGNTKTSVSLSSRLHHLRTFTSSDDGTHSEMHRVQGSHQIWPHYLKLHELQPRRGVRLIKLTQ